jgi:hypothetical protein
MQEVEREEVINLKSNDTDRKKTSRKRTSYRHKVAHSVVSSLSTYCGTQNR